MAKIKLVVSASIEETFSDFIISRKTKGLAEKTLQSYQSQFQAMARHMDVKMDIAMLQLLVVTDDDIAVRAFRLEPEQVNIVNKMTKGDQLILACAGSGKSVLLIAKCFKAARMNPDKKFLITCYNRNLQSLYVSYGYRELYVYTIRERDIYAT